jgi:hypothetical protein
MDGAAFDPGRFKSMVENGERITERLSKPEPLGPISHDTTMGFLKRIYATDDTKITSPDEFVKSYAAGDLNTADFNFLNKQWADLKTPEGEALGKVKAEFFKAVEPMIDKSLDPLDNTGKLRMYTFQMDAEKKIAAYRKAGKNPYDLLDPSNPAYLGNPAIIGLPQYQGSLQGNLPALANRPSVNLTANNSQIVGMETRELPPVPKREKGETLDSWMKRTGRGLAPPAAAAPAPPIGQ